jgi:Domain of unknown function (DUF4194)
MNLELDEFREIVDGEWPGGAIQGRKPNEDEMRRALQVMLTRQCIYSSTPGLGRTYEIVRAYASFFERFFGTLGYRLVISPRDQMVALSVPRADSRYDAIYERLRKDETIVLLALRLLWEEAIGSQNIGDGGTLETTTGELVDRMRMVTKADPPDEAHLLDILRMFQRQGAVRVGQRDRIEKVSPLTILPGVSVLVPDSYLEDLMLWAASPGGSVEAEAA